MKRFALTLFALLALCVGAQAQGVGPQQVLCNKTNPQALNPGTGVGIAAVAGQAITFCGFEATATAAATFQILFGTGASCGTGTQTVTALYDLGALGSLTSTGRQVSSAQGAAMCVAVGGTGPVHITVYYSQQ